MNEGEEKSVCHVPFILYFHTVEHQGKNKKIKIQFCEYIK